MHSDFSTTARIARERLAVPALDMGAIRSGARKAQTHERARAIVACLALAVGVIGAAGFGERIYNGIHIWLRGDTAIVQVRSMTMTWNPTAADLRSAVSAATFPVVLPVGLPAGTHVARIATAPAAHPNTIEVEYLNTGAHFRAGFTLIDSRTVEADSAGAQPAGIQIGDAYHWQAGGETVVVPKLAISARDAARISMAMKTTTPSASVAETDRMLWKTTVLGKSFGSAAIADEIAPPSGRSVLVDAGHLALVPGLVKQGKPMLDSRTIFLSDIPSVNGEPDYARAKVDWPNDVIVSAGGVRAIDAVLRSTGDAQSQCCSILFNQPNASVYWIWTIPAAPSDPVQKYVVDARTFTVSRSYGSE